MNYAGVMKGAGGGEIVAAGRSGSSRLIEVITAPDDGDRIGNIHLWDAKSGGVLDVVFGPAGELASCGRDGQTKAAPGVKLVPTRVALSADGSFLLAGDSAVQLHAWPKK